MIKVSVYFVLAATHIDIVTMKVILAGLPKTGTKSMADALRQLGYHNVYDYMEHYQYLGDEWRKIFEHGGKSEDFKRMYEGVDAVTDTPCCHYWEEIHKAFPDAKVISLVNVNRNP